MKKKILSVACVLYFLSSNVNANNTIQLFKADHAFKWITMPHSSGKYAVIAGDPKGKGLFVVRVKFPPNYSIMPHQHNHYEYDTVISGSCNIAQGNVITKKHGMLAKAGSFVSIPPHKVHYGWTGAEGAVIQLSGMGPWKPLYE